MLGHSSISATPIATSLFDPNVSINVSGNDATAITWSEIDPGVSNTWTEIKPY
jgi:hypothetical protein